MSKFVLHAESLKIIGLCVLWYSASSVNNVIGKIVLSDESAGTEQLKLSIEDLPDGLYFLHLISEGESLGIEKVIVQR